ICGTSAQSGRRSAEFSIKDIGHRRRVMSYQVGDKIGDYQIIGVLGAGGMGRVYKVKNMISDRIDAMKVLLPDLANEPDLADRFLREIKVLASLNHPNIAG